MELRVVLLSVAVLAVCAYGVRRHRADAARLAEALRSYDGLRLRYEDLGAEWAGCDYAREQAEQQLLALRAWVENLPHWCISCGISNGQVEGDLVHPQTVGERPRFECYGCQSCYPCDLDSTNDGEEDVLDA